MKKINTKEEWLIADAKRQWTLMRLGKLMGPGHAIVHKAFFAYDCVKIFEIKMDQLNKLWDEINIDDMEEAC